MPGASYFVGWVRRVRFGVSGALATVLHVSIAMWVGDGLPVR
jgi:hypothetical protein